MNNKIGFIGAGRMAQALAGGIAKNNLAREFLIIDPDAGARLNFQACVEQSTRRDADDAPDKLAQDSAETGIQKSRRAATVSVQTTVVQTSQAILDQCGIVFLAVKPQFLKDALGQLKPSTTIDRPIVVSVIAGVPVARISELTHCLKIIRTMPNTPCLIGQGAIAMHCAEAVTPEESKRIRQIFETIGLVETLEEKHLDAVTGLSGSGPAYVFQFVEAMIKGGIKVGLAADVAERLARQTVLGAANMLTQLAASPEKLRNEVTSPGGTTLAGLEQLRKNGFDQTVIAAIEAATARAKELSHY
jgi:pyrroline-5-carboxylate reductase